MFWRFGPYNAGSGVVDIIQKPGVTLEEVLDEPDWISEKASSPAVLQQYLAREDVLERMLAWTIDDPTEEATTEKQQSQTDEPRKRWSFGSFRAESRNSATDDPNSPESRRKKYAHAVIDLFSGDLHGVREAVAQQPQILRKYWRKFLSRDTLSPAHAANFARVNEALLDKNPGEMLAMLKGIDDIVDELLRHISCPVLMDLLLKLITCDKVEAAHGTTEWLNNHGLIDKLVDFIGPGHNWAVQTSAGDFLKALITLSANASQTDTNCIGPNELTRHLVSRTVVDKLIKHMLHGQNSLTVGTGIVIEVIRKNNSDYDPDFGAQITSTPTSKDPIYLGHLLRLFADHVPDFMKLMAHSPAKDQRLDSTYGPRVEPLGFDRFKTCELMAELLHCSNMGLLNEAGSEELIVARDLERQRLQKEGILRRNRSTEVEESVVDLAGQDTDIEERRLGVMNASEDDGFEQVTHGETDEDMGSSQPPKDQDVHASQKQLGSSSPMGTFQPVMPDTVMDRKDMMVAPLSPSKKNVATPTSSPAECAEKLGKLSLEDASTPVEKAPNPSNGIQNSDPKAGSQEQPPQPAGSAAKPNPLSEQLSGLSNALGSLEAIADTSMSNNSANDEPTEASIIVAHHSEGRSHTSAAPSDPVVGNYLKMQFVKNDVVPTILQVFNGPMDRGFNPTLATSLFKTADITQQIINAQITSDRIEKDTKLRQGYMGHLTLISEEVVKFTERYSAEVLGDAVLDKVTSDAWHNYVEVSLSETRERDNAVLGGSRPDLNMKGQGMMSGGDASLAPALPFAGHGSGGLAEVGLASGVDPDIGIMGGITSGTGGGGIGPFAISTGTLMSGFGSSSDEDDDDTDDNSDDINHEFRSFTDALNTSNVGSNPPSIPPPPPPPAPLNIAPSRARMQFAARLAAQKHLNASQTPVHDASSDKSLDGEEPELVSRVEAPPERPKNPFADDAADDVDDDGVDSDDGHDVNPSTTVGGRLWMGGSRGAWWRDVLIGSTGSGNKRSASGGGGQGGGEGDDTDSIDDEDDDAEFTNEDDDEEFGEFAMPELNWTSETGDTSGGIDKEKANATSESSPPKQGETPASKNDGSIVKPTPIYPTVGKRGGIGSLWGLKADSNNANKGGNVLVTTQKTGGTADASNAPGKEDDNGGEGEEEEEEEEEEDEDDDEDEDDARSPAERGIKKAVQASRRTSIEDPDD